MKKFGSITDKWIKRGLSQDPKLTQYAINKASDKTNKIKPGIILASSLVRTQQTATLLFPGKKVTVCPYIKEMVVGLGNRPKSPSYQRKVLGKGSTLVDRHYIQAPGNTFKDCAYVADIPKFFEFLHKNLERIAKKQNIKIVDNMKIVVVTHSRFLRTLLGFKYSPAHYQMYGVKGTRTDKGITYSKKYKVVDKGISTTNSFKKFIKEGGC